jgi:hypothetical protein
MASIDALKEANISKTENERKKERFETKQKM